jgi:hypothetical protein
MKHLVSMFLILVLQISHAYSYLTTAAHLTFSEQVALVLAWVVRQIAEPFSSDLRSQFWWRYPQL